MGYSKMGRLTKEIELKDAGSTKVANFTLAVNRQRKREGAPDADFVPCTVWGKLAENMAKNLVKGQTIEVKGEWQNDAYTDKDGKKRDNWHVEVESCEFGPKPNASAPAAPAAPAADPVAEAGGVQFPW